MSSAIGEPQPLSGNERFALTAKGKSVNQPTTITVRNTTMSALTSGRKQLVTTRRRHLITLPNSAMSANGRVLTTNFGEKLWSLKV